MPGDSPFASPPTALTAPVNPRSRLSEDLARLIEEGGAGNVSFHQILQTLHGRGMMLLVVLLALPFVIPVPLMGLSTPVGLAVMFFGGRIALGRRPLLPRWFLNRTVSREALKKAVSKALPMVTRMERLLRPRMHFFERWPSFRLVNGLGLLLCGFALMLPLPVPFTNTVPAIAIVLLAAGMMETDGAFILAGYTMATATAVFFLFLIWTGGLSLKLLARVF